MLAARELDHNLLQPQARTWVNTHLKFTHGYGAVVSPTREVTSEGGPVLWLQNIPIPSSPFNVQILQDADGIQYLFWVDSKEGFLYRTTDGKTRSEVSMKGWKTSASKDKPEIQPVAVGILENGLLVANTTSGCYLYDLQSGKQIKQLTEEFIAAALTVAGNQFAIITMGNVEETMTDISIYNYIITYHLQACHLRFISCAPLRPFRRHRLHAPNRRSV
jgi:hypothetical protein